MYFNIDIELSDHLFDYVIAKLFDLSHDIEKLDFCSIFDIFDKEYY